MSTIKDAMASTKIILTTSADWEEWNKRFITQAVMYDLLGHVQGKETLITKPTEPILTDYTQKTRSTIDRSRSQTQQPQVQGTVAGQTVSPQPQLDRQITFTDLTAEGQKSFSMAWTFYQDKTKAYEKQKDLIRKLKEWISVNVSSHYQQTCCEPTQSMTEWYKNLKLAAGIDKRSEETNAREKYQEALKPPKVKDLLTWVDSWEKTMTIAKSKKVLETTKTSVWFQDFLKAVRGIEPIWAAAYGISKDPQVEDSTLDYRKVANDLRMYAGQYTETEASEIAEGSFGPTFAGEDSEEHQHEGSEVQNSPNIEDATERTKGQGKQKCKTVGRKRKNSIDKRTRPVCRACEGFHPTQRCFYLFQKKAPEGWIPRPYIQNLVKQNLKEDSTLEEEVKRWRKS